MRILYCTRLVIGITVLSLLVLSPPVSAEKREPIRVYVFTSMAAADEFVGLDEHPRSDSVKDLRRALKYVRRVKLVEQPDQAELTLEVLRRDRVADGGTTGTAVPIGGVVLGATRPTKRAVVWTRLSVVGRDYKIDVVGESHRWGFAAEEVGDSG